MLKGKSRKALSTPRCRRRPKADLFYFVFPEIPRIHTVEFRGNVDEDKRNA